MAKPEWGSKRSCQACGARFYDFHRTPVTCPACSAPVDVDTVSKVRRSRPAGRAIVGEDIAGPPDEVDAVEDEGEAGLDPIDDEAEVDDAVSSVEDEVDEEDEVLIEDTADLGDDDVVSDVINEDIDGDGAHR